MILSTAAAEENTEKQAQTHLRNIQTGYELASLTENDQNAHELSTEAIKLR